MVDLNDYKEDKETEERTEAENSEKEAIKEKAKKSNKKKSGDPIIGQNDLSALAKRLGGFGMQGEARTAFEREFGSLAKMINNIFDIEEASKIVSIDTNVKPEVRLIGGVMAIVFASAAWRYVIGQDMKHGGEVSPNISKEEESKDNSEDSGNETPPGDTDETSSSEDNDQGESKESFTFTEKKKEREKEGSK